MANNSTESNKNSDSGSNNKMTTTAERLFPLSLELAEEWKTRAEKAEAEIKKLHNVIRDEWPQDQAEEIITNCKK